MSTVQDQRSGTVSSRRRWSGPMMIAAVVVVVGLIVGTALWLGSRDEKGPSTPPTTQVEAFYLSGAGASTWLQSERHRVTGHGEQVELAVNQALGTASDPDYRSGFPDGTSASVSVEGTQAVIDLRGREVEADPDAAPVRSGELALQALVHTVLANADGVQTVLFQVAGRPATRLLGQGLDGPVRPAPSDTVRSPVRLDLDDGAVLRQEATVTGTAAVFEGTVLWNVSTPSGGDPVEAGFTTATECCRPAPFSITLPTLPAGTYVLTVLETDPSDGEGRPPAEDSKTFTVG